MVKKIVQSLGFKKKKDTEFTFIWFFESRFANNTNYTKPIRTKILADNLEEAKEKLVDFALAKKKLTIIHEQEFDNINCDEISKKFDAFNEEMDKFAEHFKNLPISKT